MVNKLSSKKEQYLKKCDEWYSAYTSMDIKSINKISEELENNKYVISRYEDCARENSIIQNMTKMINVQNKKLSNAQQKLCESM